jgi:hypothetical protein
VVFDGLAPVVPPPTIDPSPGLSTVFRIILKRKIGN